MTMGCKEKCMCWMKKPRGEIPPWRKVLQSLFSIKQSFPHLVLEGSSTLYPINRGMAHKTLHCPAHQTESESEAKAELLQHNRRRPAQLGDLHGSPSRQQSRRSRRRRRGVYLAIMRPLAHIPPCTPRGLGIGNKISQNFTVEKYIFRI